MILEKGDMFSVWGKTDLFLFTSNHVIRKDGKATMGKGCARQVRDKAAGIDVDFGRILTHMGKHVSACEIIGTYDGQEVGYFMTKYHWVNGSNLALIAKATNRLLRIASGMERVDLFFPGTANGGLSKADVLPIIQHLPDNVHVWEYGV